MSYHKFYTPRPGLRRSGGGQLEPCELDRWYAAIDAAVVKATAEGRIGDEFTFATNWDLQKAKRKELDRRKRIAHREKT